MIRKVMLHQSCIRPKGLFSTLLTNQRIQFFAPRAKTSKANICSFIFAIQVAWTFFTFLNFCRVIIYFQFHLLQMSESGFGHQRRHWTGGTCFTLRVGVTKQFGTTQIQFLIGLKIKVKFKPWSKSDGMDMKGYFAYEVYYV